MNNLATGSTAAADVSTYRLPRTVLPVNYRIRMVPDLTAASFTGEVSILVDVRETLTSLMLNADALVISDAYILNATGTSLRGAVTLDPATERAVISFNGEVGKGSWFLRMKFAGKLNDKLRGFYKSTYTDAGGNLQTIGTTQFQATDARKAFPCFDEPDMKATFDLTCVIDEKLSVVSNWPVAKITKADGKKTVEFESTMRMSTYILAFVIGDLVATKPVNVDGVDIRVWCVPGREHLANFALMAAQFSLRYFAGYFGVPYPAPKLDLIAVPDFNAGAMENIGAVTFRETALLVDEKTASQADLEYVAQLVSHELGHMWFGDLVTMRWWEGIWLNEAFATFMAAKCVDAWKKDWNTWAKFGLGRNLAMTTDALASTRPVEFAVGHPDEAEAMFDELTYEKGCAVMRMLEQYLGEETFRRGIARYINRHAYGNTVTAHLFEALEQTSGQPVSTGMHGWIFASGYPVLRVSTGSTPGSIKVSQQSFKLLAENADSKQRWNVPVFIRTRVDGAVKEVKLLLTDEVAEVELGQAVDWVVVNAGGHSFCRVQYDAALASKLSAVAQSELSVIERFNLVSDSFACVKAGLLPITDFLNLVKQLPNEDDPTVWAAIRAGLDALPAMLPTTHLPQFQSFVEALYQPVLTRVGWEAQAGDNGDRRQLRADTVLALGRLAENAAVLSRAAQSRRDGKQLDAALMESVVALAAWQGDVALWESFRDAMLAAQTPQDAELYRRALGRFRDPELLKRALNAALDPLVIRTQDGPWLIGEVLRNPSSAAFGWQFVRDNWQKAKAIYSVTGMIRLAQYTIGTADPTLYDEISSFFKVTTVKAGDKAVLQALEQLRVKARLYERETPSLLTTFAPPAPVDEQKSTDNTGGK